MFDNDNVMYFHSYHTAAKALSIDRGAIKYALNNNNGRIFKIKLQSAKDKAAMEREKLKAKTALRNKVAGEKKAVKK